MYLCPKDCIEQKATSLFVEFEATAYPFLTTDIDWYTNQICFFFRVRLCSLGHRFSYESILTLKIG